jgi:hypothetical protein
MGKKRKRKRMLNRTGPSTRANSGKQDEPGKEKQE